MPRDAAQKPEKSAVDNVNSLTLAFAKAVGSHQKDKNDNLVVSPYNALTVLAMVAKAADTNTREEMAQTLFGVDAKDLDKVISKLAALNTEILDANKDQVELRTANGVWTNKELLDLNRNLAKTLKKIFGAEISAENFSDPSVAEKINGWAGKNTNNLINKIIDDLPPDAFAILASALYFKGSWTHKFDENQTSDRTFVTDAGNILATPTMRKFFEEGEVRYQDGGDYEAVALTYGEKKLSENKAPTMRLVLIRPKDAQVSARDWMAQQDSGTPASWLDAGNFHRAEGTVELPRLDIKQQHDLIPPLKEMGIRDAFRPDAADFSRMTEQGSKDFFIGKVTHDTVFKTDEKGSEAAAVTVVGIFRSSAVMRPANLINVKFDRSFVFALQDIKTGAVIFTGAVNKPNNDMKPSQPVPDKKMIFGDRPKRPGI